MTATETQHLIPTPPTFATSADEREHRKQKLAGAFRMFGRFGFGEGVAGHITCRDPEFPDHFWVNPFGMSFRQIKVSDLILVSHSGQVVRGNRPVNSAAFVIHSAIHKARPDVIAAAHAHSIYGKSWSSLGRLLDPITQDACVAATDLRKLWISGLFGWGSNTSPQASGRISPPMGAVFHFVSAAAPAAFSDGM